MSDQAIDELHNSSLIEYNRSESDNEQGQFRWQQDCLRKLRTNRMQIEIKADAVLHLFGATQETDLGKGMQPRITKLFRDIETRVLRDSTSVEEFLPIIESVARQYPDFVTASRLV